jgi:hypothetical protein
MEQDREEWAQGPAEEPVIAAVMRYLGMRTPYQAAALEWVEVLEWGEALPWGEAEAGDDETGTTPRVFQVGRDIQQRQLGEHHQQLLMHHTPLHRVQNMKPSIYVIKLNG